MLVEGKCWIALLCYMIIWQEGCADKIWLIQVLDFLPDFVEAMKNESYTLTEYEASILLPCLVEKVSSTTDLYKLLSSFHTILFIN